MPNGQIATEIDNLLYSTHRPEYLLRNWHLDLSDDERQAIIWHMGAYAHDAREKFATTYRPVAAASLLVKLIHEPDHMDLEDDQDYICFIPDEYWVKEKKYLSVTYPTYERNEMNYQKERNLGSAIHGLKTVAFGVQ